MAKFHPLKIKEINRETKDAVSIVFDIPVTLQAEYQFKQGQYLTLKLNINGEEVRRSYSICSSPYSEKELRVAVKEVNGGRASTYLNRELKIGDVIEVMTPLGNFYTPLSGSNNKQYILFAGGSGITPMMSILKSVLYVEKNSEVVLVYANKNEDSTIFKKEIEKIQEENSRRFKLISVFEESNSVLPSFQKGILSKENALAIIENNIPLNRDNEFFICGPGPLMENIKQTLESLKIKKEKIHIEYFSAVLEEVNQAANVIKGDFVSEVTVIMYGMETNFSLKNSGSSILDAALEAGVDVPFSCKGAVCCTCRAKVMEGSASMRANFALTDSEVADGFILTCQAHPTSEKIVVDFDAL